MNKILPLLLFVSLSFWSSANNQEDSLGLPGDNLDLYGVMELFKESSSLEDFEKAINTENKHINNLDLNGDDEIDYVKVFDKMEGDAHAIILQVPINETESQDVAVIEVEKTGNETAQIQIIGDEELYGEDYILEPKDENTNNKELRLSPSRQVVVVNVWFWPSVRFIYAPGYTVWVSTWRWRHYPNWWRPWRPVAWHIHHRRVVHYGVHYHRASIHRSASAHRIYKRNRTTSAVVHKRYERSHQARATRVKNNPQHVKKNSTEKRVEKNQKTKGQTDRSKAKTNRTKSPQQKASRPKGGKR